MGRNVLDVTSRVKDWTSLAKELSDLAKTAPAVTAIAVFETIGVKAFELSQDKVPVDTGALKSTALLSPPNKSNGYTTSVSYGVEPPQVPPSGGRSQKRIYYAQAVHELHAKKYGYLERALQDAVNNTSGAKIRKIVKEILKDRSRQNPRSLKPRKGKA